ncbi:Uncharacterised protein [Serratia fonticola]|uniref:Uncharacterized protein n=1 Tax=Serratia fonticola TaxID=47917 RepID=A0A4U9TS70_SERFO|nr:Uncharacterised protein [Serratia fonticola]
MLGAGLAVGRGAFYSNADCGDDGDAIWALFLALLGITDSGQRPNR